MFITDLSIRRPVVSAVFSLMLVMFGLFVFWKLPVRELPSGLQPPVVQIQVDYQSAAAPIIDQEITQVIEDVIGGAEGIISIDSTSLAIYASRSHWSFHSLVSLSMYGLWLSRIWLATCIRVVGLGC